MILYIATEGIEMRTYATADDALNFEGPGLADFVTPEELDQLIDGTLAAGAIADRYTAHFANQADYVVKQPAKEMREDLLGWIRAEIDANIWGRKQEARDAAMEAALQELTNHEREYLRRKAELIEKARELGATKAAVADALDVSRPTLDKVLAEQQQRALFNAAIEYLTRPGTPLEAYREVIDMWFGEEWISRYNNLLGIRNVRKQADAVSAMMANLEELPIEGIPAETVELLARAWTVAEEVIESSRRGVRS